MSANVDLTANTPSTPGILEKIFANRALQWLLVALSVYVLISAVGMIGAGFKSASVGHAKALFEYATNPFMGLMIGTLATALIQSSSTVTSIIVGLVAGGLPVGVAVPMIMGANIGTSITNTIVSLGHASVRGEFKRAFSAATVHDSFNLLAVAIFLPLEILFGLLEKIGMAMANLLYGSESMSLSSYSYVKAATKPTVNWFKDLSLSMADQPIAGVILVVMGIALIFISITIVGKLLKTLLEGRAKSILDAAMGRGPATGITSGALVTVMVQSSSTTTSLMIPLAGSGVYSLKQIYPFTLGANIGTCVTALLAATAVEGNAMAALTIAMIHLSFNVAAVLLIYGLPVLRQLPLKSATWLGELATHNKFYALVYLLSVFFLLPMLCVGLYNAF